MTPAFRALEKVLAALKPLNPEDRRKVIEAVHALLPISAGESHPAPPPKPQRRKEK